MLIVFEDDGYVHAYPSVEAFGQEIEGLDAEETLRSAFDEAGTPYRIEWLSANTSGRTLGLVPWAASGRYALVPAGPPDIAGLRRLLDSVSHALPRGVTTLQSLGPLPSHSIDVRDPGLFLQRMLRELAGGARLSLEGNLAACKFDEQIVVSRQPLGVLTRNTISPEFDFVILSLEPEAVRRIFAEISSVGLRRSVVHVQVDRDGVLELGAYDNFHSECVMTGPAIPPGMLAELRDASVIRGFGPCPA